MSKYLDKIKPIEEDFGKKLEEDKVFLLSLIDDPVKTFRIYGFKGDERMVAMLKGMALNIRKRAILIFNEILGMVDAANACNACNACTAALDVQM